nr:G-type lectin S-receptor-like serine/threonine-protein kinase LECRK3 [Coffea arabica]
MAVFLLFLLSSVSCLATALAQQSHLNISLGSSLTPTGNSSSWSSHSGLFAFGFYQQGNGYAVGIYLAGIPGKTVIWTANRLSPVFPSNVSLVLSSDGRLILQHTQGQDIVIADPSESISSASMLDSGNFVLYNSDKKIVWQSFEHPTNTLLPGQQLATGHELYSSASETDDSMGIFRIKMQDDGNLVQYPVRKPGSPGYAYYASNTFGNGVTLNLDGDGHLYLINSSLTILSNLTKGGYPQDGRVYMAKIDVDGIFRLYSYSSNQGNRSILWESVEDKCAPKGLCGPNGFCTMMDNVAECRCPPGFDFVNPGNWSSGCERNFTTESCKSNSITNVKYEIRSLANTVWEDNTFATMETSTQEDCEKQCLDDCNCEAAFYKDGECRKQRLPLTYGKRTSDSNVALVKVGTLVSISESVIPSSPPKSIKKEIRVDILVIGISLAVFGVMISVTAGVYVHRNQVRAYKKITQSGNVEFVEDAAPKAFTFAELEVATNDFREELGRGAFGAVYKGVLPNSGKVVAVKKLEKVLVEGEKEFQNEIRVIGRTHHRNLIQLLGYCLDGNKRLLVYKYMSNGSLADILFKPENHPWWDERIRIASDVARGILYLHEECETQIIHCDIKPQNILMDDSRCAKISDFGLAKPLDHDRTRTYTAVRGTRGYVAPEWHRNLPVTVKADVYSYGIVLLEIICCRKNVDSRFPEEQSILEVWAYDCFMDGELHKLVGEEEAVDMTKLERMIRIALWCIQNEPTLRPSMKKVVLMLEGTVDVPVPPSPDSFFSAM